MGHSGQLSPIVRGEEVSPVGRFLFRYGPPAVVVAVALYCLWRAVELDGDAAHRGYAVGVILLACGVMVFVRLLITDMQHTVGSTVADELAKVREHISAGNADIRADIARVEHDVEYRAAAGIIVDIADKHRDPARPPLQVAPHLPNGGDDG